MRARCWLLSAALLTAGLLVEASAQQGVRWQPNLETARRIAAQTNRLVLIHFWADPCEPCRRMEQDVFSRADVAAAMEANYVPVQVNAQHLPKTARDFGVTRYPTEIIMTPQGDVVDRTVGASFAQQYVDRLNRIAANVRTRPGLSYAQLAGGPPAGVPEAVAYRSEQPSYERAPPPEYGTSPVDDRPTGSRQPTASMLGSQRGQAMPGSQGVNPSQRGAQSAPQGYLTPPWSPGYDERRPPGATTGPTGTNSGPDRFGMEPPRGAMPSQGDRGLRNPNLGPSGLGTSESLMAPPPSQGRSRSNDPWAPPMADRAVRGAPPAAAQQAGPPPLGMEGFCPIQLLEKDRWVRGDRRYGVIHRGRLYLFAGPEEARRFYADPDRYAPVISGNDIVAAVDQNENVPGLRKHGAFYDGRVYLFSSEASLQAFRRDPARYAAAASEAIARTARRSPPPVGRSNSPAPPPGTDLGPRDPGPNVPPGGRY